jgi:hypothetical protein
MRLHVHRVDTEYGPTAKREVFYRRQQLIDWIHPGKQRQCDGGFISDYFQTHAILSIAMTIHGSV